MLGFARPYLIGGAVALLIGSHGGAYWWGWSSANDRWEARVASLTAARQMDAARIDGLSEALERAQAERDRQAADAEAEAEADDDAGRVSLPPRAADRVLGR